MAPFNKWIETQKSLGSSASFAQEGILVLIFMTHAWKFLTLENLLCVCFLLVQGLINPVLVD